MGLESNYHIYLIIFNLFYINFFSNFITLSCINKTLLNFVVLFAMCWLNTSLVSHSPSVPLYCLSHTVLIYTHIYLDTNQHQQPTGDSPFCRQKKTPLCFTWLTLLTGRESWVRPSNTGCHPVWTAATSTHHASLAWVTAPMWPKEIEARVWLSPYNFIKIKDGRDRGGGEGDEALRKLAGLLPASSSAVKR